MKDQFNQSKVKVKVKVNKVDKGTVNKTYMFIFLLLIIFILLYFIIYLFLVYPLYKLNIIQTKEEIKNMTELLILGATDKSKLSEITNIKEDDINLSFFYTYFFFKTPKYTIWTIIHKHNKFSNNGNIVLYYYDNVNNYTETDIFYINFDQFKTYLNNGKITLEYLNNYKQEIDFNENKMSVYISTNKNELNVQLYIDEYNTTVPSLLNRYKLANRFGSTQLIETHTPNEWASDNPLIGKIVNGYFNDDFISGNFWFDNFIGTNNFFISEYYWFVILNDEWLIYILFYGSYDDINSDIPKPLFIKNRKENKIIHCSPGVIPSGFKTIDKIVHPINIKYNSTKKLGVDMFDDYSILFKSNEITINMRSIKNQSVRTLLYDYYSDPQFNESNLNGWDKQYNDVLNNLKYVEYVNRVNVEISYNNTIQTFQEDQIIDAVFVKDNSLPSTIQYV